MLSVALAMFGPAACALPQGRLLLRLGSSHRHAWKLCGAA
jgi:hypothetical protein